jgi:hypothetical protein
MYKILLDFVSQAFFAIFSTGKPEECSVSKYFGHILIGCFERKGRLAQRESIGLTSRGSQVQILYRPPEGA